MRLLLLGCAAMLASLGPLDPWTLGPQDPQRPIFRSDAHFVTVDAYPVKDGKVVEGLTAADFIVEEDGKPQSVQSFEFVDATGATPEATRADPNTVAQSLLLAADARMRAFVVYLDIQHVSAGGANQARGPLITFLNRLVGENDLIALTTSMVLRPTLLPWKYFWTVDVPRRRITGPVRSEPEPMLIGCCATFMYMLERHSFARMLQ